MIDKRTLMNDIRLSLHDDGKARYTLDALKPGGWDRMPSIYSLSNAIEAARLGSQWGAGRLYRVCDDRRTVAYFWNGQRFPPDTFTDADVADLLAVAEYDAS